QRRVGSTPFTIIPLVAALTPVKNGALAIGPIKGSVVVHVAVGRAPNRDPFDLSSFFGPRTEPRRVDLELEPQNLQVRSLPSANVPANFNGAVGTYTMAFSAGPTNVAVGDPITLKIQISGQGNLDAITLSQQSAWQDFKLYPPSSKIDTQDSLGIQGTKSFE